MFRKYVFLSVVMVMILGLLGCGGGASVEEEEEGVAVPTAEEVAAAEEHYVQAHNLRKEGRFDEAIEEYNKTIELNPNYAIAYAGRSQAYFRLGQYELAIHDAEKAIELAPDLARSTTFSDQPAVPDIPK